ncbi:MAG TPA: hypothetical protein PLP33_29490 [Leptospiraceae bacterium]|nr:hypothetical protein [Leptospiraceae bacterium]
MKAKLYFNSVEDSNKAANILAVLKGNGQKFQYYYNVSSITLEGWPDELNVEIVESISTLVKPAKVEYDSEAISSMFDGLTSQVIQILNRAENPVEAAQIFREWLLNEAYVIEDSRSFAEQEKGE